MKNYENLFAGFEFEVGSKSLSWRSKCNFAVVTKNELEKLARVAIENQINARLCLNSNSLDRMHSMLIAELAANFILPKKNLVKDQIFHVIRGMMGILLFDKEGNVMEKTVLDADGNSSIFFVGSGVYHCSIPLTPVVLHHELRTGPFIDHTDREFLAKYQLMPDLAESRSNLRLLFTDENE